MTCSEAMQGPSMRGFLPVVRRGRQWALAFCLAVGAWGWVTGAYGADVTMPAPPEVVPGAPLDTEALTEQSGGIGLSSSARLGADAIRDQMAVILWDEAKRVRQPQTPTTPQAQQGVMNVNTVQ